MIFLLSPAKKLICDGHNDRFDVTTPKFLEQAEYLMGKLRKKSPKQLEKMMHISADLGALNHERNQVWTPKASKNNSTQAALLFKGDVYVGLQADSWNKKDFTYAQDRVRILSGLYGLLKPLDAVKPYRLEMGSSFAVTPTKNSLYKYWGSSLQHELEEEMQAKKFETIVNLASNEYSKAAKLNATGKRVITASFKELHKGEYKALMVFVKKARGLMTDFAVKNKVKNPEDLKAFDREGYLFAPKLSTDDDWVFTRKKQN